LPVVPPGLRMEPWLDSLSEDWKSEHNSSSLSLPNPTPQFSKPGSVASNVSQSRIPHLAQNRSKSSTNGKYLRSRSLRGTPPLEDSPVLVEQNLSKLNIAAKQPVTATSESQRKLRTTALPRRASSALSDSAQSVQHYTLQNRSTRALEGDDIPEWKRRLARGEDIAGDGCDLFGPSRLEGMFKAPPTLQDENQPPTSSLFDQPRPQSLPSASPTTSTFDHFQSMKASRARLPGLDIVEEVNEETDITNVGSRAGEAAAPKGSLRGLVKQRVSSLDLANSLRCQMPGSQPGVISLPGDADLDCLYRDPRIRTMSGQEELKNEWISPISLSKQNTIRDRVLRDSLDKSTAALQAKLEQLGIDDFQRPLSRSSDQGVVYGHSRTSSDESVYDETGADLTSQSLPDDLSMGTQDFISHGGFVNKRRGGFSNEGSFHRKTLSSSKASSHGGTLGQPMSSVSHSSPLLPAANSRPSHDRHAPSVTSPMTPPTSEQAPHHKQPSVGSPLKLFGNRDTYTNNKLLRVLSHFEDAESVEDDDPRYREPLHNGVEGELRMSQFGQGELDRYDFVEEVKLKTRDDAQRRDPDSHIFSGLEYSESFEDKPSNAARGQRNVQSAFATNQGNYEADDADIDQGKRDPTSPLKERTPKRRRTLLRQEIEMRMPLQLEDDLVVPRSGSSKLAGTKRKDARYDDPASTIDPESLAGRQMLRPRMTHRRTSNAAPEAGISTPTIDFEVYASRNPGSVEVREAVAEELVQVVKDARKTSVTTQDYMEEATKIMQMIRAKGKPKNSLASVEEPVEESELNPDAILDLDIDEVSSGDEFSRPPSRNGGRDLREQRRQQQHDPRIASHLRKFKESDDLELLIDTSALEPMFVPDNAQAEEAALVPIPEDEQQSSPPNIRIRSNPDTQRKRKHSASTTEDLQVSQRNVIDSTHSSSAVSTQRTVPTSSTGSSGRKGVINPGKVQIPDQVGAMTFDHATKTWVKERIAVNLSATDRRARQATSEEDPFEHISDLSTEELREAERNNESQASVVARPSTRGSASGNDHASSAKINRGVPETYLETAQNMTESKINARTQLVEHETRIHDGWISRAPNSPEHVNKQPRVVTIAFSSPLVSAVAYQDDPSTSELEVDLTARDSEGSREMGDAGNGELAANRRLKQGTATAQQPGSNSSLYKSWSGQNFVGRPVSRIEEHDEVAANEDMSLIPTSKSEAMTPVPRPPEGTLAVPHTAGKVSSMICLTPLPDFSLHQVDRPSHEDASFVAPRRYPAALRQAHGSLALGVDDMMKAITDVEPSEPYWDHIRRLDLTGKCLTTLNRLEEYCSTLEELIISTNELGQLSGVPLSVRTLDVQKNYLSNMTSWGHLQNLQYLNISGNELQSLEGLSCLYHLRELNANDNKISDIDGILDLNGLQCLTLQGNELESLDFEGGELTKLTRLDVSRNQIAHVHTLSWLPALEDLNLEQNNLREFACSDLAPLVSLRHLRISKNQLRSIDLSACPNIESLYLDRNNVTEVKSLDRARHLHTLSLREQTDSHDIIGHVLSTQNDCRKIFLSSNSAPGGKLRLPSKPLFSLRYLELASCGISSVAAGFGTRIPNCRVLNMNFNAIGCISRLQGMSHLNKLLLAGNRLERLRRSCLALSRHPALTKVDLRNNPLTVGFYSPAPVDNRLVVHRPSHSGSPVLQDPYVLPRQVKDVDHKWVRLLDEGTRLRRRTIELLLAQKCADLVELDGMEFDRDEMLQSDDLWEALTELGVLKRPMLLPQRPISAQEENLASQNHMQTGTADEERSLMIA
jgi:Leucine-rich repeat (LRR) protein